LWLVEPEESSDFDHDRVDPRCRRFHLLGHRQHLGRNQHRTGGESPEFDRATAYALGSGFELGPVSNLTGTLFVFGHLIGTIILGLALWRSCTVPSWAALLLAVSQPIHLASVLLGNRPLDLVGWGGTAVGLAAAGGALSGMNNDDFDPATATG